MAEGDGNSARLVFAEHRSGGASGEAQDGQTKMVGLCQAGGGEPRGQACQPQGVAPSDSPEVVMCTVGCKQEGMEMR